MRNDELRNTQIELIEAKEKYVELHNGEISLDSEPGKGTKFFVKNKKKMIMVNN
ncbi:MAG: hypothetical protein WCA84_10815 [Ignavibacteriaceae bacterium]|jgi:hypothetical protein